MIILKCIVCFDYYLLHFLIIFENENQLNNKKRRKKVIKIIPGIDFAARKWVSPVASCYSSNVGQIIVSSFWLELVFAFLIIHFIFYKKNLIPFVIIYIGIKQLFRESHWSSRKVYKSIKFNAYTKSTIDWG